MWHVVRFRYMYNISPWYFQWHVYRKFPNKGAVRPDRPEVCPHLKSRGMTTLYWLYIGLSYTVGKLLNWSLRIWKQGVRPLNIGSAPLLENLRYLNSVIILKILSKDKSTKLKKKEWINEVHHWHNHVYWLMRK